jgi:uncharacterized membrane protein
MSQLWETITDYDSRRLQIVVIVVSFVSGFVLSVLVAIAWESVYGRSRVAITLSRYTGVFVAYIVISYSINKRE